MSDLKILWQPDTFTLDNIGKKRYQRHSDGDTTNISVSIRMLSIDTPEIHYPGNTNPSKHDAKLQELAQWIQAGQAPVDDDLAAHLYPRLVTGDAGSRQKQQGDEATDEFSRLVETRLKKDNGKNRDLFVRVADTPFDSYGRLLAYIAPHYTREERAAMPRTERATFNLRLVASGWAAPFVIYPSIPGQLDLELFHQAAKTAFLQNTGAWADPLILTGYEFRMAYRLWETTRKLVRGEKNNPHGWISRYCADMTTRKIYRPQQYHSVQPFNRLFIWRKDVRAAVGDLNLEPATD